MTMKLVGCGKTVLMCKQDEIDKRNLSENQLKSLHEWLCTHFVRRYFAKLDSSPKGKRKRKREYSSVVKIET